MALTLADYKLHAQHAVTVDGSLPGGTSDLAAQQIVNQAGRYMFKHPWQFRIAPPAILGFTGPLDITGATWTESTKTITKTAGFASYTFAKGDILNVTGGTGATAGRYTIASRTSDDAIVLSASIGSDADGKTDIAGQIEFPYVNLPSDFGNLVALDMNSSSFSIYLTTIEEILQHRMRRISVNSNRYRAAIVQPGQTAASSALPTARLELDHAPTSSDSDSLFLIYRRKWTTLSNDTSYPEIPEYAEDLLIEYVRAFAEGYMNRHADADGILPVVSMNDRLSDIDRGPIFQMTKEQDGLVQSDFGPLTDGPAGHPFLETSWRSRSSGAIADPS